MEPRTNILDEPESLRWPFVQSAIFHVLVFGVLVYSTLNFARNREVWGASSVHAGDVVTVHSVTIPLPSRAGHPNPVANDTESQVPLAPKQEVKKRAKEPEPKAIPLKSRLPEKRSPRETSAQKYRAETPRPNQVFSHDAPALQNPMFQKPGAGGVGVGPNNTLGNRFGAYADLVTQRVTEKWNTDALGTLRSAPLVIITFDIMRDGSVRNAKIAQSSGNSTLDYSALRAVMDAGPFPPLPPQYDRNEASVELQFQLKR